MKIIYKEFLCPKCGQFRWLKINGICVNCRDEIVLDKIAQSRKLNDYYNAKMIV